MTNGEAHNSRSDNSIAELLQKIRVPIGFAFATLFAIFSHPTPTGMWVGIGVASLGVLIRVWATGYLRKHEELCIFGPYRYTRNPLYLGSFLVGLGFSVAASSHWILLVFVILFFAVYAPVMRREEQELIQAYGASYEGYQSKVPLFIPAFRPFRVPTPRNFSWRQLILNREYKAVLGFLTVCVYLLVKLRWL